MLYRNDDPRAILAMEEALTGNYGEDGYYSSYERDIKYCPVCGACEPDYFYMNDDGECVGCDECVHIVYEL